MTMSAAEVVGWNCESANQPCRRAAKKRAGIGAALQVESAYRAEAPLYDDSQNYFGLFLSLVATSSRGVSAARTKLVRSRDVEDLSIAPEKIDFMG